MSDLETAIARIAALEAELAELRAEKELAAKNTELFDRMDFDAYSTHDWSLFRDLHSAAPDVVMPDGTAVHDLDAHVGDMQLMVSFMPDARVLSHPIKVAQGDWTAVIGVTAGTFTAPMILPDGTRIEPTGKRLELQMATFARWENGRIAQEILFWDNTLFNTQLGL
ncbi:ketosteroid isomerase-like protein [Mycetocola sp. BIGb0189]|uniref:ester cyclase n=1 Tax=Mycetocola sp. BIGb0189 TaxID=2940604 RepID=UPI0021677010|nr:ester cyclase [Mycetocola sp. BIGb0189]MCS4275441.1 ketosteroid isomerase-like protein [Mycetocola sp. BIGb0189]